MSCCGKSSTTRAAGIRSPASASYPISSYAPRIAHFRCTGNSTVTAVGAVSGRLYRFPASGLIVQVDARDAISLARVPRLAAVRPGNQKSQQPPRGDAPAAVNGTSKEE